MSGLRSMWRCKLGVGSLVGAVALLVTTGCGAKEPTPENLCDALVKILEKQVANSNTWGLSLDPGEARDKCMEQQTAYQKQNRKEFESMARCALMSSTVQGWRHCGYPRRR